MTNEKQFFRISGYFEDNKQEFNDLLVCSFNSISEDSPVADEDIYCYGVSENNILDAIESLEPLIDSLIVTYYEEV